MVMISPSLIESSMFCLKHMTSFWFNCLFMDGFPCLLLVCKKHVDAYGKDSKHANTIHISIIGSCGGSVGSAVGKDIGSVGRSGSFIVCIASILLLFFTTFKILS